MEINKSIIIIIIATVLLTAAFVCFATFIGTAMHRVNTENSKQIEEASEKIEKYRAEKEALVAKGKKKDAVCYVDGIKQDTDFDPDGLNLDNYDVEYKENHLYFKKITKSQASTSHHTSFFPMFLPIFH